MNLTEKLDKLEPYVQETRCRVCQLPKDVLEAVDRARARNVTYHMIAEALLSDGHKATKKSLQNHYAKEHTP